MIMFLLLLILENKNWKALDCALLNLETIALCVACKHQHVEHSPKYKAKPPYAAESNYRRDLITI